MADDRQSLESDNLSPQSSTSGYPLEVRVIQVNPEQPAPGVDSSPPPPTTGGKRKRESSTEDEAEEEIASGDKDSWVVESLSGLKMKLKKKRMFKVLPEHHEAFTRLLDDHVIRGFLEWDESLKLSDKYLLAMVVAYFSRAGLFPWQYQRIHFFMALYLALDMEESDQVPKQVIFSFLYGDSNDSRRPLFHKLRLQFCRSMDYRARVTREECEEIMAFNPDLWVWKRDRIGLSEITEAKVPEPRGDPMSQEEVNPGANDKPDAGKEASPVQAI